jgi:hypothetical protein
MFLTLLPAERLVRTKYGSFLLNNFIVKNHRIGLTISLSVFFFLKQS